MVIYCVTACCGHIVLELDDIVYSMLLFKTKLSSVHFLANELMLKV